jgi:hypothetical protein
MNFVYLRSSRLHVFKLEPWFMHWQQGGERKVEKRCIASLKPIPRVKGELVHFFCVFLLLGGVVCCTKSTWPVLGTSLTGFCGIGLTGFWNRPDRIVPRFGTCSGGACICAGGALICVCSYCSLLEHGFVSDVSSRCPCLRGPRLVFFKWSCSLPFFGFQSLVGAFFYLFIFFFLFSDYQMCVLSMHASRGDWGPCVVQGPVDGRFLVWWVIDNVVWTDSWLSIAGAGSNLTRIGAGWKQARKVVAGEASRCGEDN